MAEKTFQKKTAPCQEACPAGVDVPRYIKYLQLGMFDQALGVIRERIPFPGICGYACLHPCETQCGRRQFDEAVAIRMLKKAAADNGNDVWRDNLTMGVETGKTVAVIGSGPSGLTAAYYLAGKGHRVTVFEARALPGGMMRYCIPDFRLPNEVIDREIAVIRERGVQIITIKPVASPQELLAEGYDAVLASTGAWGAANSGIQFVGDAQVTDGITFLEQANIGQIKTLQGNVVVVGGGNTACDVARTAKRLGAESVTLVYRRSIAEMPANKEEIQEAIEEGVKLELLANPVQLSGSRLTCTKMALGKAGTDGRPAVVQVPGSEFTLTCDYYIEAIGQFSEAGTIGLAANSNGTAKVAEGALSTDQTGVFAAGDLVTGPSSIIQAIAQGRSAAECIDRYLGGDGAISETFAANEILTGLEPAPLGTTRAGAGDLVKDDCKSAVFEAGRCLGCDSRDYAVEVSPAYCKECGFCQEVCGLGVYQRSNSFNAQGFRPMAAVNREKCVGCLKCLMICPDFAVSVG